jgi:hypothetical protein
LARREKFTGGVLPAAALDPLTEALRLLDVTTADHQQRALDPSAGGPQDLHDLRVELREPCTLLYCGTHPD